jgi:hypothetical protein
VKCLPLALVGESQPERQVPLSAVADEIRLHLTGSSLP